MGQLGGTPSGYDCFNVRWTVYVALDAWACREFAWGYSQRAYGKRLAWGIIFYGIQAGFLG